MLRTVQSFEYENSKKRQITFSLSELLHRKTIPLPEEIMNSKMTRQNPSRSMAFQVSYKKQKSLQSQSFLKSSLKINYQILRTKSCIRTKKLVQPQIITNRKFQPKNQQKDSEYHKFEESIKSSKIIVNKRTINQKNQKMKAIKQQTQPVAIQNNSLDHFTSLKTSNHQQKIICRKSFDSASQKQFLKKGASLKQHLLDNLLRNKVLQQNFSSQKFNYQNHKALNMTKIYKGLFSSIQSTQIFNHPSKKITNSNFLQNKSVSQNKASQRSKTSHNYDSQSLQKQKGLKGWQISSEIELSFFKNDQKCDPITDSSWNQVQEINNNLKKRNKKKILDSKKKLNPTLQKN